MIMNYDTKRDLLPTCIILNNTVMMNKHQVYDGLNFSDSTMYFFNFLFTKLI
jgi:hypothetical protein